MSYCRLPVAGAAVGSEDSSKQGVSKGKVMLRYDTQSNFQFLVGLMINVNADDDSTFIQNNSVRGLHHLTQPTLQTGKIGKLQYMKSGKLYLVSNSGKKYEVIVYRFRPTPEEN